MFEREIKFIYDFNVNQVKKLGNSFAFNSLTTVGIHPAILKYISAEIDYLIYEDRKKIVENSNFDYTSERINKYFIQINDEIRKEKRLSVEYVNQLIIHATSFTVNFLAQPKWALTKLIFAKENILSVNEVRQILKYPFYYSHLYDLLEKIIVKKKFVSMDKSEFENLVDKIYRQLFSDYSERIMDSVLYSMADFFNVGSIHKTNIPYFALELFLKEKRLDTYLERLNASIPEDAKQSYDIFELKKIIYAPIPVKKGNYLDRVVKQEEPQILFSSDKKKEEVSREMESTIEVKDVSAETGISEQAVIEIVTEPESESSKEIEEAPEEVIEQESSEPQFESEILPSDVKGEDETEEQAGEFIQEIPEGEINSSESEITEVIEDKEKLVEETTGEQESTEWTDLFEAPEEVKETAEDETADNRSVQDEEFIKELSAEPELESEPPVQEESVGEEEAEEELSQVTSEVTEEKEENKFFDKKIEWESEPEEVQSGEEAEPKNEETLENIPKEETVDLDYSSEVPLVSESENLISAEKSEQENDEKKNEEGKNIEPVEESSVTEDETIELKPDESVYEKENLETVIDEKDLLMLEEDFDESYFNILEEDELEKEEEKLSGLGEEAQEDFVENEVLEESVEVENPKPEEGSKVLEEINDEIKNLSDDSELEFKIDELEKIEEPELEKSEEEPSEVIEEKSLTAEEKVVEEVTIVKENKPVKFEKDISYFFKGKNIDRIISRIFDDDAEDFAQTFEKLSECNSIKEAFASLDALFESNRVKPTSKEAVLITDIVTEYFNQK
jgi:hypothetical protein